MFEPNKLACLKERFKSIKSVQIKTSEQTGFVNYDLEHKKGKPSPLRKVFFERVNGEKAKGNQNVYSCQFCLRKTNTGCIHVFDTDQRFLLHLSAFERTNECEVFRLPVQSPFNLVELPREGNQLPVYLVTGAFDRFESVLDKLEEPLKKFGGVKLRFDHSCTPWKESVTTLSHRFGKFDYTLQKIKATAHPNIFKLYSPIQKSKITLENFKKQVNYFNWKALISY